MLTCLSHLLQLLLERLHTKEIFKNFLVAQVELQETIAGQASEVVEDLISELVGRLDEFLGKNGGFFGGEQ